MKILYFCSNFITEGLKEGKLLPPCRISLPHPILHRFACRPFPACSVPAAVLSTCTNLGVRADPLHAWTSRCTPRPFPACTISMYAPPFFPLAQSRFTRRPFPVYNLCSGGRTNLFAMVRRDSHCVSRSGSGWARMRAAKSGAPAPAVPAPADERALPPSRSGIDGG